VEKAIAFNTRRNNRSSLTYNYNNMSDIYMGLKQPAMAIRYAHMMLDISRELDSPFRLVNGYNNLAHIHRDLGQFDSAYHYKVLHTNLSDSLNNVKRGNQIAESQTRYETGKKEAQISELSEKNKLKNQRLILAFGLAGLFAVMIGVSVYQNRRLKKQKEQIQAQSDRLQWMMKELHHRVKNNLQIVSSLLNLQTYRLKDQDSVTALRESQLRVQAMSLIHQRLYQVEDVSMVNFKLYLSDLADTLMKAYGYTPDDFDLTIRVEREFLDVDTVMPMGLLVNEIITNSFKYAFGDSRRPMLDIRLKDADENLELVIRDNGPGIPAETAPPGGFGRKLIDALTKQLKGRYTLETSDGTAYYFTIPQKAA
jgi:two-component sensor histidine kinase